MKDNELRGLVLQKFYDLRRRGFFQWVEIEDLEDSFMNAVGDDLLRICDQLGEHNLIDWKPETDGRVTCAGVGKISAHGIDVVEGNARADISVSIDNRNVSITSSSNVIIGNSNTQNISNDVINIIEAINNASCSEAEKKNAKSALRQFLEHPATIAVLGGLASSLKDRLT